MSHEKRKAPDQPRQANVLRQKSRSLTFIASGYLTSRGLRLQLDMQGESMLTYRREKDKKFASR